MTRSEFLWPEPVLFGLNKKGFYYKHVISILQAYHKHITNMLKACYKHARVSFLLGRACFTKFKICCDICTLHSSGKYYGDTVRVKIVSIRSAFSIRFAFGLYIRLFRRRFQFRV